jgi:hypothetical protein
LCHDHADNRLANTEAQTGHDERDDRRQNDLFNQLEFQGAEGASGFDQVG